MKARHTFGPRSDQRIVLKNLKRGSKWVTFGHQFCEMSEHCIRNAESLKLSQINARLYSREQHLQGKNMTQKIGKKDRDNARRAELVMQHDAYCLRNAREIEAHFMTVLGKYRVERQMYTAVETRLKQVQYCLLPNVEYSAEELIWGELFDCLSAKKFPEIVLSLKHIAAQPNALIKETRFDRFTTTSTI
jgi:hypothetical protein